MPGSPRFRLRIGEQSVALHDGRTYVIGQGDTATIRVVHGSIADEHARLSVAGDDVVLEDLHSSGGTFVGGIRVQRAKLVPGDRPRFGDVEAELTVLTEILPVPRPGRPGHHEETFQEIMARELAHAPWFLISVAAHAVLLLLLSWLFATPPAGQKPDATAKILLASVDEDIVLDESPQEVPQVEEVERDEQTLEPRVESMQVPEAKDVEPAFDTSAFTSGFDGIGLTSVRGKRGGSDDIFGLGSDALRKGNLRATVAKLRETGLEIVFVFDSTGSMDRVLMAAKRRIFRMVETLHALVPTARIGIVTYRDRGGSEEYVTRNVPVTLDVYRVMNFMHTIQAAGGGDFEEAVLEGLKQATTQRWLPNSRRVVVLIGDAPPHREDERSLRTLVQSFARGQAFVHAIATVDGVRSRQPNPDTKRSFESIATEGHGVYSLLEGEDTILKQVLALAFGTEHRRDLDEVYALVDRRTQRTEVAALDIVQRGDLAAIEKGLRHDPVDDEIVKAAIKLKSDTVTRFLVEKLGDARFPSHARQACSYAVMRILELRQPPLDPEGNGALAPPDVARLLQRL
ncbi:MAG: VWA domain-containing protein [Planctomycetota bacterium]